ncbi:LytTR family DNA-binding domain-containing protein [Phenylobacterium sp.]|uniref:LytTR family DNA-binding domain-containing protein n=1 Tax=Phenylobacterium sp. TaxID=1871053 RepID=UPI002FE29182
MEVIVNSGGASKDAAVNRAGRAGQAAGDERRPGGDGSRPAAPNGAPGGTAPILLVGWGIGLAIAALVMAINIVTRAHDAPEEGWGRPILDEASSALSTAVVLLLPIGLALWTRRRAPPRWRLALAWIGGGALYPVLHVGGFVALRSLAYPLLLGGRYDFGAFPAEFLYEATKDVPAFAFAGGLFWLLLRWRDATSVQPRPGPAQLDIRDGARLVRAPLAEILAVRSAGNYAEVLLEDGRRPLMRSSLAALEARLGPHGFVRTHRSWLVNSARVRGLRPEGSGDYAIELGLLEAPLSRRFRPALEALRG